LGSFISTVAGTVVPGQRTVAQEAPWLPGETASRTVNFNRVFVGMAHLGI